MEQLSEQYSVTDMKYITASALYPSQVLSFKWYISQNVLPVTKAIPWNE